MSVFVGDVKSLGVVVFLQELDHPERERVATMLLESEDIKRFQLGEEKASL